MYNDSVEKEVAYKILLLKLSELSYVELLSSLFRAPILVRPMGKVRLKLPKGRNVCYLLVNKVFLVTCCFP